MSEGLTDLFTAEEISNMARLNASGIILAITAFAEEHSLSAEMNTFIGRKFAPGWRPRLPRT